MQIQDKHLINIIVLSIGVIFGKVFVDLIKTLVKDGVLRNLKNKKIDSESIIESLVVFIVTLSILYYFLKSVYKPNTVQKINLEPMV
jgi:hypothetical protein